MYLGVCRLLVSPISFTAVMLLSAHLWFSSYKYIIQIQLYTSWYFYEVPATFNAQNNVCFIWEDLISPNSETNCFLSCPSILVCSTFLVYCKTVYADPKLYILCIFVSCFKLASSVSFYLFLSTALCICKEIK